MRLNRRLLLAVGLSFCFAACGTADDDHHSADNNQQQPDGGQQDDAGPQDDAARQTDSSQVAVGEVRSKKQRISAPIVADGDLEKQVAGNNAFALDLYQQACTDAGNLIFSPHSISMAMAMVHGGARAQTEQQLAQGMHFVLPQDELHPAFNKLDLELESRGQNAQATDGKAFRLKVSNAMWGQKDYPFLPEYLDLLALNYDAGLQVLDFEQTAASRQTINDWIAQETESRIKDLIGPDDLSPVVRLVLTNAIYFNAAWAEPFEKNNTVDGTFHRLDGSTVTASMMRGSQHGQYAAGVDYEATALAYDGGELSMLVIVPKAGSFDTFEKSLDASKVDAIVSQLKRETVSITLPRFENRRKLGLNESLSALGISDLFSNKADLTGITDNERLYVSKVIHEAFIKVDEAGTEAAAATAVISPPSASTPKTLVVDRPFIYLIRDHATGAILFVGRVVDPTA